MQQSIACQVSIAQSVQKPDGTEIALVPVDRPLTICSMCTSTEARLFSISHKRLIPIVQQIHAIGPAFCRVPC